MTITIPPSEVVCRHCKRRPGEWCVDGRGRRTPHHRVRLNDAANGGKTHQGNPSARFANRARGAPKLSREIESVLMADAWLTSAEVNDRIVKRAVGKWSERTIANQCAAMHRKGRLDAAPDQGKAFRYAIRGATRPGERPSSDQ